MPTINKLGSKPVTKGEREKELATQPDAVVTTPGNVTLIESKASTADISRVKVPSFLQRAMPETSERELTGYIGYASEASKHFPEQQAAGLSNGDIFLMHQGQYLKLDQLEFFLTVGESFKSAMDQAGRFIYATRDLSTKEARFKYQGKERFVDGNSNPKLNPHYICLCIVNVNGRLIPIKGDFIGTKSGGIESAISAVRAAADPKSGWMKLSDAHQTTAAFPDPFGRVYHTLRTKYEVAKSSGMAYHRTVCVSAPATVPQMSLLMEHLGNDEFNALLNEAHKNYVSRVDFMDQIVQGENPYSQQ